MHCNIAVSCSVSTTHTQWAGLRNTMLVSVSEVCHQISHMPVVLPAWSVQAAALWFFTYCHYQAQGSSTSALRPSSATKMTSQSAVIFFVSSVSQCVIPGGQRSGGSDWSSSRPRNSQLSFSRMEEGASLTDNISFEKIKQATHRLRFQHRRHVVLFWRRCGGSDLRCTPARAVLRRGKSLG